MAELSLDELYQKTIDDQRNYLLGLQNEFNKKCDEIRDRAQAELAKIPNEDREGKQAVLVKQKEELEEALRWLKGEVNSSTMHTMKKLEEIQRKREERVLSDLEKQIAALT